ncbi:MAG TPA: hypothetical protein VGM77_05840 [Gemmatimonadales bacterium]|jgi:hypothetical protein
MFARVRIVLLSLALGAATAIPALAQTSHSHIGLHVLYNTTFEDAGAGAQFSLPIARHLEFYPSVDVYFESGATLWQPNLDFKYRALGDHMSWFYLGTGLGLLQQSYQGTEDNHAAWNLFAGAESLQGQVHPFVEARLSVSNYNRFQFQGGVNITLGHH